MTAFSEKNLAALRGMVDLCRARGVRVFLLRLPLHDSSKDHEYDNVLVATMKSRFPDAELLDMNRLSMPETCFLDAEHTNGTGAAIISGMLHELLKDGLLDSAEKQSMIDRAIVYAHEKSHPDNQVN
jgi:hypothetical protein